MCRELRSVDDIDWSVAIVFEQLSCVQAFFLQNLLEIDAARTNFFDVLCSIRGAKLCYAFTAPPCGLHENDVSN